MQNLLPARAAAGRILCGSRQPANPQRNDPGRGTKPGPRAGSWEGGNARPTPLQRREGGILGASWKLEDAPGPQPARSLPFGLGNHSGWRACVDWAPSPRGTPRSQQALEACGKRPSAAPQDAPRATRARGAGEMGAGCRVPSPPGVASA